MFPFMGKPFLTDLTSRGLLVCIQEYTAIWIQSNPVNHFHIIISSPLCFTVRLEANWFHMLSTEKGFGWDSVFLFSAAVNVQVMCCTQEVPHLLQILNFTNSPWNRKSLGKMSPWTLMRFNLIRFLSAWWYCFVSAPQEPETEVLFRSNVMLIIFVFAIF